MLKSKNPDLFLPNKWPTYFSKTLGCYVWDLDNKKYIDRLNSARKITQQNDAVLVAKGKVKSKVIS